MALNDIKVLQEQADGSLRETLLTPAVIGAALGTHTHPANQISDATSSGRTLLTSNLNNARAHLGFFPLFNTRSDFPVTGEINRVYTAADTARIYAWVAALGSYVEMSPSPVEYVIACSDETTNLTAGDGKVIFRAPVAFRLTDVAASVSVAPTGSDILVDVRNGANSALTTQLSIDAGEKTSFTAATPVVINSSFADVAQDTEIRIDLKQRGSLVAGVGLKVVLRGARL
jgi:hypothetical protein